ncbi:MAG: ferrous iron transporter B [Cloacibacillus porcorum]|nr:ferrous iron transporter B [Cloacibacillus porcorum]
MSCKDCKLCFDKKESKRDEVHRNSSVPEETKNSPAGQADECGGRKRMRILLMGNPNVGKSVFFSRLTGVHALSSNYPGTTVGFTQGLIKHKDICADLIDVPGAYTLDPTNEAEEIARRIIEEGADKVILVIDATALERNLVMSLQVLSYHIPVIVALNMTDEARHKGILLNVERLEEELGVPIYQTVATTGRGISDLVDNLDRARISPIEAMTKEERWQKIGKIIAGVQTVTHRHHTLLDRIEDISAHPVIGVLLGFFVLALSFTLIRFVGEGLINYIFDPIFENLWLPFLEKLSGLFGDGYLRTLLIGKLFDGSIDLEQSMGVLSTGFYVEFGMVLPYIIAFYAVLSFLEDFGYLPRLAVVFDALLHRFGIHGYAIIPTLLGFGCNVPGILATRVLESERERFIAATLISVGVPCVSIQAMLASTLGGFGMWYVGAVYFILFIVWLILGRLMHLTLSGYSPELIVEIPPYRLPSFKAWMNKLWFRIKDFFFEATPLVLGGILLVNILDTIGLLEWIGNILAPFFQTVLGLPAATAVPVVMGLFRKDIAMGLLIPLDLTAQQMLVAVIVLSMTFPCIATFVVMWKELGVRRMLQSSALMLSAALITGAVRNLILNVL